MGHLVQRTTTNLKLSRLSFKSARAQMIAENGFESKHRRLCERPTMIAAVCFPLLATLVADLTQIFVTRQGRLLAIAVLPNLRIPAGRDVDLGLWRLNRQRFINIASVITAIGRHARNRLRPFVFAT